MFLCRDVYRLLFWGGGGGGMTFLHIVLFLFSDVEHSCLTGSLDLVRIKRKCLIQLKSNLLNHYNFLSGRGYAQAGGGGKDPSMTPPCIYPCALY